MTFLLSLLGIGKNVLGWLTAGVKYLFAAWYRIALAVALAAFLWAYMGWTSADNRAAKWKRTAEVEMSLRIANEVAYKDAQKVAAEMNRRQVEKAEQQRKELALGKDLEIRRGINAALADARRVWAAKANQSSTGRSGAGEVATGSVDPNGTSGLSVLDERDVQICTINTMKAKGWQDFYEGLRAAE